MQNPESVKDEARRLIEALSDEATWDDFAQLVYERQMVRQGIDDLDAGRTWTSDEIRDRLGITR